jgi:hypothetical protein
MFPAKFMLPAKKIAIATRMNLGEARPIESLFVTSAHFAEKLVGRQAAHRNFNLRFRVR